MKKILFLWVVILIYSKSNSQHLTQQWATPFAGTGENSDRFNDLIRDASGNIYACGYTWRSGNGKDFLLVKFNSLGDTLWTRTYDGTGNGNDELNDIIFDNSGNVIVVGTAKTTTGKDITTSKYNTAGSLQWVTNYNGFLNLDDYGVKVVADNAGNIYSGGYGYNSNLNNDYIVVKYSSAGSQLGAVSFNGADGLDDELADMAIDGANNIVVTGKSKTASVRDDYATVKYNSSLVHQWTKTVDQAGKHDRATGLWIDASGDVYVTGRSSNGNNDDYLTIKYLGANGSTGWSQPKLFNSNGDDQATAITGNANAIVVTGTKFNGIQTDIQTIAYLPSTGAQLWSTAYANTNGKDEKANHVTIGTGDIVVVTGNVNVSTNVTSDNNILVLKYNNQGTLVNTRIYGGGANLDDNGFASVLDADGNTYSVGALVLFGSMKDAFLIASLADGTSSSIKSYNGEGEFTDRATAMCVSGGNLYTTGYTYTFEQDRNFCTIKYDAAGNIVWVRTLNGPDNDTDEPEAIASDGSGNIYVAGRSKNANNDYDMFVIKYNPNGDTLWTRNYDGGVSGDDEIKDIAVDGNGNVYITGISDEDASLLVNNDFMTVKYSPSGILLWAVPYNGTGGGDDRAYSIALDNTGNAYVAGRTWNGADYDIQIQKYASANGAETAFATYASNLGDDIPVKIKLDNNGNVIVGATSDRDASASTDRDYVIIQCNSSGTQQWVQFYNGAGTGDDDLYDLMVDVNGNIYVTGSSDLDSSGANNLDYVTVKYNSAGAKQWSVNYNGAANSDDVANAISLDATGNVFVTGQANEGISSVKNNNAVTLMYDAGGNLIDSASFNGAGSFTDAGEAILLDNGSVYVCGYGSYSVSNQKEFLTIKYDLGLAVNEISESLPLVVYPNPCSINSGFWLLNADNAEVTVYNSIGEKVYVNIISYNPFISTGNWAAGMYFIRLQKNNYSKVVSLVIQ